VSFPISKLYPGLNPDLGPEQNQLLAALPASVRERLFHFLIPVQMSLGDCLYESGSRLDDVYFPTTAILSLLYVTEDGTLTETAMVGNDGMLGIAELMGGGLRTGEAIVQCAGHAFSLKTQILLTEFNRAGPLMHLSLRYTQALMTQIAQTAGCNRHHDIYQHVCRWLLMSLDRHPSYEVIITQELIANMLGVRRESVTAAVNRLQQAGLIHHYRCHILVLDRPGLEAQVCECYQVIKREYDSLLSPGISE
jgi:CRP-like cAMP-binding protein